MKKKIKTKERKSDEFVFLCSRGVKRYLVPHSPHNGTGFVLSLYYQKSVIEYKEAESPGRIWFEADINYIVGRRGTERILYSNDGLIFVTRDHYHTFTEIVSIPSAGSES